MSSNTDDVRIQSITELLDPEALIASIPASGIAQQTVTKARTDIHNVLKGVDDRLVVVVGPCSIHDPDAALDYGQRLKVIADSLVDDLCIVMRVYFEKPRTIVGWKGLINDPELDGTFQINKGLSRERATAAIV